MASKKLNPAPLAKAAGFGNVVSWQAIDTRLNTPSIADLQAAFIARRTRLAPEVARLIAEFYFDRRAA